MKSILLILALALLDPGDGDDKGRRGNAMYRTGEFLEASNLYREALIDVAQSSEVLAPSTIESRLAVLGDARFVAYTIDGQLALTDLESETIQWCREMLRNSPIAIRCMKAALNADCDGQAGLQELAGNATLLFYMTEEGQEGRNAFNEKRKPNFAKFPRRP